MTTILIIDDEPIVREPLAAALRNAGYDVTTAAGGVDALNRVSEQTPDLILLDIAMPMMSGLTLLRVLRKHDATRNIPVLILTAASDKGSVVAAATLGIKGYIVKRSFALDQMLAQIASVLENAHSQSAISARVAGEHADGDGVQVADSSGHVKPPTHSPLMTLEEDGDTGIEGAAALSALKPLMTKSGVMDVIDECADLKGFSPAVSEVLNLTNQPDCAAEEVAQAITRDPAVAIKVLQLANTALYTRGERIDSVLKAVLRIGLSQIRQALTNLAVIDSFSAAPAGGLELSQFWEHSIATGSIAAELARDRGDAATAFTVGLLHDVGRLVLAQQLGSTYQHVLDTARTVQLPLELVEQRLLGATHAQIMDHLLRRWQFNSELVRVIACHHVDPDCIGYQLARDAPAVATIELANRLSHAMMWGSSGNETLYPIEALCTLLGIDNASVLRVLSIAHEQSDQTRLALLATAASEVWEPHVAALRRRMTMPFRPLYVSEPGLPDACRLFVEQLAPTDPDTKEPPNIAIVYMRSARDREACSLRLREIERERGVENVPLLTISPSDRVGPTPALCGNRRVIRLGLPFWTDRFFTAVNVLLGQARSEAAA